MPKDSITLEFTFEEGQFKDFSPDDTNIVETYYPTTSVKFELPEEPEIVKVFDIKSRS